MLYEAAFAACTTAALASVPVARRRREHLPVAVFLWYVLGSDIVRQQLIGRVVRPAKDAMRAAGIDPLGATFPADVLVASHVEHALYLGTLLGLPVAASTIFLGGPHRPGAGIRSLVLGVLVWLMVSATMTLSYPRVRGQHVAVAFYLPVAVASVAASVVSVVPWVRRRVSPQVEHVTVGLLVAVDLVDALMRVFGRVDSHHAVAIGSCLVVYSFVTFVQGVWLWWSLSSSCPQ
jgi:hypothetical protein